MTAATQERPLLVAIDGARTTETGGIPAGQDVCVPTRPDWPKAEFFDWFDAVKRQLGITSDNQMAMHLGIGHTVISGWRNDRQRPSFETLNLIAGVLGMDPRPLWVLAGLVTPGEVGLLGDDQAARPVTYPAEVVELLELLADPRLDAAARDQLLGTVRVLVAGTRAGLSGSAPTKKGLTNSHPSRPRRVG